MGSCGPIRLEAMMARLLNAPVMLDPGSVSQVFVLRIRKLSAGSCDKVGPASGSGSRPYDVLEGVAVIPIHGILIQRNAPAWDDGVTGYDDLRLQFLLALRDPSVSAILFDIDSPGGVVAGCFDLVDSIYLARGQKPIWAVASEHAYSAAYAIASAADRIVLPRTGGVGSIGIIWLHVDVSGALADDGQDVTLLTYGRRKADGMPTAPLSRAARVRFQANVDELGELFVRTVARNRGLAASTVRDMEAACYLGQDAVSAGLADAVATPDGGLRALIESLRRRQ